MCLVSFVPPLYINFCGIWLLSCPFFLFCFLSPLFYYFVWFSVPFVLSCRLIWCRYRPVNRRLLLLDLFTCFLSLTIPVSMCRPKRLDSWHPCAQRDSNFPLRDVPMVINLRRHGCHGDAYRGCRFRRAFIYLDEVFVYRLLSSRLSLNVRCLLVILTSTG